MLTIWTNKIKHSTGGSSFSVTFSVAPNELEYLNKLYDCFSSMNWSSFPITTDRKTENSSEFPNNCEVKNYCDDCLYTDTCDSKAFFYACTSKATISKMEQVEDETRLTAKCLNCNNAKACKEKHWDGCVYEPKDEKTCETCRHWKYIAHEWQCEACKCQGYEPKDEPQIFICPIQNDYEALIEDEPQTDCAWK